MNWAFRFIQATPGVEPRVAAPFFLNNGYLSAEFQFFIRPLQKKLRWLPEDEWQCAGVSRALLRIEQVIPLYRCWLEKTIRTQRPDVLHAHFGPVACRYAAMAKRLNIPLVASFYGYDFARVPFEKPAFREKYRHLFQQAALVTATGDTSAQWLIEQGCPPEKTRPVPLGISIPDFQGPERTKKEGRLHMLQIATFTEKKGHLDTLEAFRAALKNAPDMQLTLAGERQDRRLFDEVQQFIRRHELEARVRVLDFVPHERLPELLQAADLFIHPSRTTGRQDREGSPVVIAEAQASGLPVVSTRHADIPQLVLHEKTGLLAPERAPEALTRHIERFYHMGNDEWQTFSRAAGRHAREHYAVEKTGRDLKACYEAVLQRANHR